MNRKLLALLLGALTMFPTQGYSRSFIKDECLNSRILCLEKGNTVYTYNRSGIPVSYSKELSADLWSIHRLDIKKIYNSMYGTRFSIDKKIGKKYVKFTLITDSNKDKPIVWYQLI